MCADIVQRLGPGENTLLGVVSGLVDVATTQWMLYGKTTTQQKLPLSLNPRVWLRVGPIGHHPNALHAGAHDRQD